MLIRLTSLLYPKRVQQTYVTAQRNDATAQFQLGCAFANGEGVKKNLFKAVQWFRCAAEQGHARAQCRLGIALKYGLGIEQDTDEAEKWFYKSIAMGNAEAQTWLNAKEYYSSPVCFAASPASEAKQCSPISSRKQIKTTSSMRFWIIFWLVIFGIIAVESAQNSWREHNFIQIFIEELAMRILNYGSEFGGIAVAIYAGFSAGQKTGKPFIGWAAGIAILMLCGVVGNYLIHIIPGLEARYDRMTEGMLNGN